MQSTGQHGRPTVMFRAHLFAVKARPHRQRADAPKTLAATDVEVLVDDDDDDDADEQSPPPRVEATPAQLDAEVSPAASSSFVADVRSGRVDGSRPESAAIALPSSAASLLAAGTLELHLRECDDIYHSDFPLLALRRLLLLETLVCEAGLQPLRERTDDARIEAILSTERELDPMLRTMLGTDWTLITTKRELQAETWLRVCPGGRAAVKVTGVLPHSIAMVAAPLLHPHLYSTWVPGVSFAKQLVKASNFRRLLYLRAIKIPIPFLQPRDAVLTGYGDIYSPTSVIVHVTTLEPDDPRFQEMAEEVERLSPAGSTVRMSIKGGFIFEMLPDGQTRIQCCLEFDIKLKVLPPQVIDWFMKHLAVHLIPKYDHMASKFERGGRHEQMMHTGDDAETYVELKRRLAVLQAPPTAPQ